MLEARLLCHFIGNILVWIFNMGTLSIDEVVKKDNSKVGLIFFIVVSIVFLSKT